MKSTSRFTARRVFQGGAAFAAFGALSLAAAMPANADGQAYGWAAASAAGGEDRLESHITQNQSESGSFDTGIGDWLTVSGTTSVLVDDNGAKASAVIENGRVAVSEGDLENILNVSETEEGAEGEGAEEGAESEGSDEGTEGEGAEEGAEGEGSDEGAEGDEGEGEGSDEGAEGEGAGEGAEGDEGEGAGTDGDDELQESASGVIELNEGNSVLTDGGGELLFDKGFTGSVSTTQTWSGDVTHESAPEIGESDHLGRFKAEVGGEEVTVDVVLAAFGGEEENTDSGYVWDDAFTFLTLNFAVDGEYVSGFPVAESIVGITTGVHYDDADGDDGSGGEGEDKTPPKRTEDNLPKPDPKEADLAQTGTPVAGLIAAGVAIAAGGGAAAYLARRRKDNATAEFDETNEN